MVSKLEPVSIDSRRSLTEFGMGGTWKVCKYLEITEDCIIGDHYHKQKDECFFLAKGSSDLILGSDHGAQFLKVVAPEFIDVPRGTYHKFTIMKGSILIGLASEEHDPTDDYKP